MFSILAELTGNVEVVGKGIMLGAGMIGPGIGVGLIGNAFMNAVGRNPEAAKFLGQILVFVAIVELMALLVFASLFIIK
jgi:F0F1-type ATP synthase membrane subunit c/vacuolar-type H+-ATPase subunit K